ncbi:nucleoside 2-deoxyribosyltransferase [Bifidobacterium santillanense]|uniref:nucleoside 2-deoxyribosyltransferase n=1 Tax=Bifidobacterium santillanense TaxID=2809028 RepID=UPI0030B85E97
MSEKQYDFYVAGPFFDPEQAHSMEQLEGVLERHGRTLFKPRFASQIEEVGPEGCFEDDIRGIQASDAVIANLMDEDAGTMFEIGYAHAMGMPVYGYSEGLTPMGRVNLMVAQAVEMVFSGPEDLAKWLETGEHEEIDYIQF